MNRVSRGDDGSRGYFAVLSQWLLTEQASRRPGPAVVPQLTRARRFAAGSSSAIAQPKPGVPGFGSIARATHWSRKVSTTAHSDLDTADPVARHCSSALAFAISVED